MQFQFCENCFPLRTWQSYDQLCESRRVASSIIGGTLIHIFVFCIIHFLWNRLFLQSANTNIWIRAPPIIELATRLCERLSQDDQFKKTYDLNKQSVLNDSKLYHVVGGLPPDAMHDILEGVLPYTVKEVLNVFIWGKQLFSLEVLNNRITAFDFGYHNDTNKPALVERKWLLSSDNSLRQHGA